nr:MAG TPA: hypothetical protein [Caudoviricetes sp.]
MLCILVIRMPEITPAPCQALLCTESNRSYSSAELCNLYTKRGYNALLTSTGAPTCQTIKPSSTWEPHAVRP